MVALIWFRPQITTILFGKEEEIEEMLQKTKMKLTNQTPGRILSVDQVHI